MMWIFRENHVNVAFDGLISAPDSARQPPVWSSSSCSSLIPAPDPFPGGIKTQSAGVQPLSVHSPPVMPVVYGLKSPCDKDDSCGRPEIIVVGSEIQLPFLISTYLLLSLENILLTMERTKLERQKSNYQGFQRDPVVGILQVFNHRTSFFA